MSYDELLETIGSFGPYQKKMFVVFFLNGIPNALLLTSIVFLHYIPEEYKCSVESLLPPQLHLNESTVKHAEDLLLPRSAANESHCTILNASTHDVMTYLSRNTTWLFDEFGGIENSSKRFHDSFHNLTKIACTNGWNFVSQNNIKSAMMEFNGVCDRAWYKPFISSLYMGGMAVATLSGFLSDRFGRRPVFLFFTLAQFVTMFLCSFANNIQVYGFFIFLCGVTQMVNYMSAFVMGTEITTADRRNIISISSFISFSVGYMIGPFIAYLLPNWRWFLRANSFIGLLYIPMYWLFPESPRWLLAKGRLEEAKIVLKNIAIRNGKEHHFDKEDFDSISSKLVTGQMVGGSVMQGLLRIVKTPAMLWMSIVIGFSWMVTCLVYFGLSLSAQALSGDIYINCLLLGAIEIPGVIASYITVRYCSRPRSHAAYMLLSGACCLIAALMKRDFPIGTLIATLLGKGFDSAVFYIVYIHTAELVPTLTRNTMMCFGSAAARAGSVLAPYFVYLVDLYGFYAPYLALSMIAILCSILVLLFLPETKLKELPDTVEDVLRLKTFYGFCCKKLSTADRSVEPRA